MTRLLAVLMFTLLGGTSCLRPVQDVLLGTLDAGAAGGGATGGGTTGSGGGGGGGATGGGGGATGGGGGGGGALGGGGGSALPDAGLVTSLARLPEAQCGLAEDLATPCLDDAGSCISLLRSGQAEVNVATDTQVAPGAGVRLGSLAAAGGGFLFMVRNTDESLWYARAGAAPRELQRAQQLNILALAEEPSYGVWYIAEPTSLNGLFSRNLMLAVGLESGGAAIVASPALTAAPTSNGVAVGTDYFVAFPDGLHSFYPAGGSLISPLTSVSGDPETIVSIAADATDVAFLQCTDFPARCALRRWERGSGQTTTLVRDLTQLVGGVGAGVSVALTGGHAYVLGVLHLLRVPRAGGALELVYAGEEFPQYTGTLRAGSLTAISGKLYFGSVCHFDADAPGYGAVELDPVSLTARWLELDPNYPFVPYLEYRVSLERNAWATPGGVFVAR